MLPFFQVQCFPIYSVLQALNFPVVDYFSLDIEGAEYQVLKTIPFKSSNIKLFGIETVHAGNIFNGTEADITELLRKHGYQYVGKTKRDKFYQKSDGPTTNEKKKTFTIGH